jgi:hypothetical protein
MKTTDLLKRALGLSAMISAGAVYADFTKVDGPPSGDEPTQAEILSEVYGGSFSGNGDAYTNGDITARRLKDVDAANTDQTWKPGKYTLRSLAKFTSEESRFYASSPAEPQLHTEVVGFDTGKSITIETADKFHWKAIDYYGSSSTDVNFNSDDKDHFVTYEIQGDVSSSGGSKFVMFWEDLPQTRNVTKSQASWSDFNDLVVEVQAAAGSTGAVIPLPPAVYAGSSTLMLIGIGSFLRHRVRHAH